MTAREAPEQQIALRVVTIDPGIANFAMAIVDITHVSTPGLFEPSPGILKREIQAHVCPHVATVVRLADLDSARRDEEDSAVRRNYPEDTLSRLDTLVDHFRNATRGPAMPEWRRGLLALIERYRDLIFTPYWSTLTERFELPVLAMENQMDLVKPAGEETKNNYEGFNRARMYTLANITASIVEALDSSTRQQSERTSVPQRRLIINAAAKHAIKSDGSLTYDQRKARAIVVAKEMLYNIRDNVAGHETLMARDAARQLIIEWQHLASIKQKLDDAADALLLAYDVAVKVHRRAYLTFWKKQITTTGALSTSVAERFSCYLPIKPRERKAFFDCTEQPKIAPVAEDDDDDDDLTEDLPPREKKKKKKVASPVDSISSPAEGVEAIDAETVTPAGKKRRASKGKKPPAKRRRYITLDAD